VGESARSEFGALLVADAAVGVASKDSAFSRVQQAVFEDVDICGTVYRKKQAFDGGTLILEQSTCDSGNYREQEGSMLRVGNS
jgi:hypothetical protein